MEKLRILIRAFKKLPAFFFVIVLLVFAQAVTGFAQTKSEALKTDSQSRDGQHDFDWEIGNWKLNVKRLKNPLTGSTDWSELSGTVVCRKIWDGKGNLAEIKVDTPTGLLEFMALRLYNPKTRQWTNTFAGSGDGVTGVPMYGEYKDGRGEFYDQETFNGKTILVRFIFTSLTPDSGRSEQAFSNDGGKTWETNWINTYTRIKDENVKPQ